VSRRHVTSVCIAIVVAMIGVCWSPTDAHAVGGGGTFGGVEPVLGVGLLVSVGGSTGGEGVYTTSDPDVPRPVFTRAIPAVSGGLGDLSNLCMAVDGPPISDFPLGNGWWFNIELFATSDGHYIATTGAICVALDPDAPDAPPPAPALRQPPTIGEVWRTVALPAPSIGVSPEANGVTGLATWVWTGGSTAPVAVAVSLRGYTITGTARVTGFAAFPGVGGWLLGDSPGTPEDPAFTHTYEQTGTYRLGVATMWSASAVLTGPGLATPLVINLGTALVTNGRDYPVVEIRSRLL